MAKPWSERIQKRDRDKCAATFFAWFIRAHCIGKVG